MNNVQICVLYFI